MNEIDEYKIIGIAYSLMAKTVRFDKKINDAYCKASEVNSISFDEQWKVFVKECRDCIDEFEQVYERILKVKRQGSEKKDE